MFKSRSNVKTQLWSKCEALVYCRPIFPHNMQFWWVSVLGKQFTLVNNYIPLPLPKIFLPYTVE